MVSKLECLRSTILNFINIYEMKNTKISIIGCGNLGQSILRGILSNPDYSPENIIITKRNTSILDRYKKQGVHVTNDNKQALKVSQIIIVALKPHHILDFFEKLKKDIHPDKHVIVSLATGISILQIQEIIGKDIPIFRAMPNTASDVQESVTCISYDSPSAVAIKQIKSFFNCIGKTVMINENLMESATVLGACGIAYVMRFMRAMTQGGIQIGFDAKTASDIVNQTVKGASQLLIERENHPEHEIDKVTTPKGCTIAGLNEMEHNGFSSALIKGVVASFDKIEK